MQVSLEDGVVEDRTPEARVWTFAQVALDELPEEYASRLENVQFLVQETLTPADRHRLGIPRAALYGLYEGIPLTRRTSGYNFVMPDRITLYWGPMIRNFPEDKALAEQVKKTLHHEIAHYFGLSEADLAHTRVK